MLVFEWRASGQAEISGGTWWHLPGFVRWGGLPSCFSVRIPDGSWKRWVRGLQSGESLTDSPTE
jgi:hypothetical protein